MEVSESSALSLFQQGISRRTVKDMARKAVESVLEVGNPLEAAEALKGMDEFIKAVKEDKRFKDYVLEEMNKYHGDCTTLNGSQINPHFGGGKWDFSVCNDPVLKSLELKVEERKSFLKGVSTKGEEIVDEETGEMVTIYPPNKPNSGNSYAVTLKP